MNLHDDRSYRGSKGYVYLRLTVALYKAGDAKAALKFAFFDLEGEAAISDVQFDAITRTDRSQRAADGGFGRNMKDDGAIGGAAHPRITDSKNVHNAAG